MFFKLLADYLLIKRSNLFDEGYYYQNYADVRHVDMDALWHFVKYGWKEGRNPSDEFTTNFYLNQHHDVSEAGINPLIHYLSFGKSEGRFPTYYILIKNYQHNYEIENYGSPHPHPQSILHRINSSSHHKYQNPEKKRDKNKNKPRFSLPHESGVEKFQPELINWNGVEARIVKRKDKIWVIKQDLDFDNFRGELLVHSLARGLVNAAEINSLTFSDISELLKLGVVNGNATPFNTILIRLAQEYKLEELPIKSHDLAMAGEYVFSLWVRRHDATKWNRAYTTEGIPVFFDYQASLDCEPMLLDPILFFSNTDPGYGGSWRVVEREHNSNNSCQMRDPIFRPGYIHKRDVFDQALDIMVSKISSQ